MAMYTSHINWAVFIMRNCKICGRPVNAVYCSQACTVAKTDALKKKRKLLYYNDLFIQRLLCMKWRRLHVFKF